MKKRLKPISAASIAVFVLMFAVASVAEAGHKDLKYEYHLGDSFFGCTDLIFSGPADGPTCRPEATAEDFPMVGGVPGTGTIAIQGSGVLTVKKKDGKPKRVKGGGLFEILDEFGVVISEGTWKAKKLLMFDSYGPEKDCNVAPFPCAVPPLPIHFEGGRALIRIELRPDEEKKKKIIAVLEVGCRLPGSRGIVGTIEGVRVMVDGGLNYNVAADPKSTLFVNLQTAP